MHRSLIVISDTIVFTYLSTRNTYKKYAKTCKKLLNAIETHSEIHGFRDLKRHETAAAAGHGKLMNVR